MNLNLYKELAQNLRIRILELAYIAGKNGAHVGGGLSLVEILSVLYLKVLKYDVKNPESEIRDRFILSKGHGAIALFSVLEQIGLIEKKDLDKFEFNGSPYYSHAKRDLSKGIEFSGGSLSLGLPFAVGVALMCRKNKLNNHVYVLIGDGEADEGLIWESLMSTSHFNLTNITVIVDYNGLQSDGFSSEIMNKSALAERIRSFGFNVNEVDGHNTSDLIQAFDNRKYDKANAIIAHTTKGKGVSFMENNVNWHHGVLSKKQFELAITENKQLVDV